MTDVTYALGEGVARVALNRPARCNALRPKTCHLLVAALDRAEADADCRAVVLTGEGGSFCAGADLMAAEIFQSGNKRETLRHHIAQVFHPVVRRIRALRVPVIASIPGAAVGFGFDLALACDLRVVAEDAKLGPTFGRIGLVPDGGSPHSLQWHIGPARTLEWIFTGEIRRAGDIADWGLFNRVVPAAELETATDALVRPLVEGPPLAIRAARALVYGAQARGYDAELDAECEAQLDLLLSQDFGEGVGAFFDRRKPRFRGE